MGRMFVLVTALAAACAHGGDALDGGGDDDDVPDGGGGGPADAPVEVADGAVDAAVIAPDAPAPDAPAPDATLQMGVVVDETAFDFGGPGAGGDAVIGAGGYVEPPAYFTGGLRVSASDTGVFTSGPAATWADVMAMAPTGRRAPSARLDVDWVAGTPAGLGLTSGDDFTVWYEGEIYLDAGAWTFHLWADDHAFLELAPPGTQAFARVVSADWDVEAAGGVNAATSGWYPVRMAVAEQGGNALVRVRMAGPGFAGPAVVPAERLRFRVDDAVDPGLALWGFDDSHLVGDGAATLDGAMLANVDWGAGRPADVGVTADDTFSVRWAGQVRLPTAGAYAFRLVTDDGQRLWIDGALALDAWDVTTHDATTAPINLAAGWHDVVVDQLEQGGGARATLLVASGPELAGSALPLARLRPVVGRGERVAAGVNHGDVALPDLGQAESTVTIDAPAGATVTRVDVSFSVSHSYWNDVSVELVAPDGAVTQVRPRSGGSSSGTFTDHVVTTGLNGHGAAGAWRVRAKDNESTDSGTLLDAQITVHHGGGAPPIAPTAAWEAGVWDLGPNVVALGALSWLPVTPAGTQIVVRVRGGASEAACLAAAWSAPLASPSGSAVPLPATRYVQYRVELTSNGDAAPWVDWVRLDYVTTP